MKRNNTILLLLLFLCIAISSIAKAQDNWILVEGGSWVPDNKLLSDLKARMAPYILNESKAQGNQINNFQEYTYQYQGREENGHPYIFVNAFCEVPKSWPLEKEMLVVFDGGKCYFTFKYDKSKRIFYHLVINGEA